jgi:hypothetical protein
MSSYTTLKAQYLIRPTPDEFDNLVRIRDRLDTQTWAREVAIVKKAAEKRVKDTVKDMVFINNTDGLVVVYYWISGDSSQCQVSVQAGETVPLPVPGETLSWTAHYYKEKAVYLGRFSMNSDYKYRYTWSDTWSYAISCDGVNGNPPTKYFAVSESESKEKEVYTDMVVKEIQRNPGKNLGKKELTELEYLESDRLDYKRRIEVAKALLSEEPGKCLLEGSWPLTDDTLELKIRAGVRAKSVDELERRMESLDIRITREKK